MPLQKLRNSSLSVGESCVYFLGIFSWEAAPVALCLPGGVHGHHLGAATLPTPLGIVLTSSGRGGSPSLAGAGWPWSGAAGQVAGSGGRSPSSCGVGGGVFDLGASGVGVSGLSTDLIEGWE